MPIPRKSFPIDLTPATPTPLTPEALEKQLHNIGLTCDLTKPELLAQFIAEVEATIPQGSTQTYQILKPAEPGETMIEGLEGDWAQSSVGNWEPDSTAIGYGPDLEYLIYPEHFDWLKQNVPSFTGTADSENFVRRYDSVDAIKDAFVNLALTASSALVKGLNNDSIESVFSNVIAPLNDDKARDYDKNDSRVIFLVEDYDPTTKEAAAVGVLGVSWHLVIKDYKVKKEAVKHDTTLDVTATAVLYSELAAMKLDVAAAKAHFKGRSFGGRGITVDAIPVIDATVKIYDDRPPANRDTFLHSLPLVTDLDKGQVVVLYAPDLQNLGSVDNTGSAATSTYSKSVSSGFTFSSTQKLSIGAEFEAGIVLAKGKVSVGFELSFTESSTKTTTETMAFAVPAGEMAFLYQGTLRSQVLQYDPSKDTYQYLSDARFLSPVLVTTKTPIGPDVKATIVPENLAEVGA